MRASSRETDPRSAAVTTGDDSQDRAFRQKNNKKVKDCASLNITGSTSQGNTPENTAGLGKVSMCAAVCGSTAGGATVGSRQLPLNSSTMLLPTVSFPFKKRDTCFFLGLGSRANASQEVGGRVCAHPATCE